jgi:ammonium transporter, Amt family
MRGEGGILLILSILCLLFNFAFPLPPCALISQHTMDQRLQRAGLGGPDAGKCGTRKQAMNRPIRSGCLFPAPWALVLIVAAVLGCSAAPALAQVPAATHVAASVSPIDTGATAWMLMSSALVMLMVPGLALFYAGMVRRKNVLGTMMHSMTALAIIGVEWIVIGYALTFGTDHHGIIGWDSGKMLLWNVLPSSQVTPGSAHIPEYTFIMFQGMFAIITPALIAGAFAERVKFSSYMVFTLLWGLLVYNPLAHWVWAPGGWLGSQGGLGAIDFAGGTVVHISAGASALVMALYLGKRIGYPTSVLQPNSLVLTLLGAGLLWFGWFGFNGGSATAADQNAALAFTTTQVAAAAGAFSWLIAEWMMHGRPTSLGVASGLVAGLVAITPASGFVSPASALVIGGVAGVVCYMAVLVKSKLGYDDSLDAFGVHGVGGFLGAVLTGVFCSLAYNSGGATGGIKQVGIQLLAAFSAMAYAGIFTLLITFVIDKVMGFRVTTGIEIEGVDVGIHGEQGWLLEQTPTPAVELPGTQLVDRKLTRVFPTKV